jgi:hypothetical protein
MFLCACSELLSITTQRAVLFIILQLLCFWTLYINLFFFSFKTCFGDRNQSPKRCVIKKKKTAQWMSRNAISVLIYHDHKLSDLISIFCFTDFKYFSISH